MNTDRPIDVLCDRHNIHILLFVRHNSPCFRTDVYEAVGHSASMPKKLDVLVDAGLINIEYVRHRGIITILPWVRRWPTGWRGSMGS